MSKTNEQCVGCDLYKDGHCTKYRANGAANPSSKEWFTENVSSGCHLDASDAFIPVNRVCRHSSIFGNYYFGITDEDIERLKNGEVMALVNEYGIFIGYVEEEEDGDV